MKTIEELISQLPEIIYYNNGEGFVKAFLEITFNHVYYCTRHDNEGNISCVFVAFGDLRKSLEDARKWINYGVEHGSIIEDE